MQLLLPNFNSARILIVGDVMLDRYWSGNTARISPEAPVPVVHVKQTEERPGGAGNVALNVTCLGSEAVLFGACGADAMADSLEAKLKAAGVECYLQRVEGVPTITKLRVLSLHQQLLRLDFEENFPPLDTATLLTYFRKELAASNLIIISDYAKGSARYIPQVITAAKRANIPVFVDPKGQDFQLYQNATLLTPNRREFEAVVGPCHTEEELVKKGIELLRKLSIQALLVTRGEQGMTLIQEGKPEVHLPARAREVYDVTGAGDTVIAVLAASYAGGNHDFMEAATLANLAAGIVVGKLGAATVSMPELRRVLREEHTTNRGIMTEEQLIIATQDARAQGERIVMTGGCFDILHAGHVSYLEEAKSQGDRLIVAVNDDASVARLKGPGRPINTLARRMAVLSGLSAVDWVVSFSEKTPEHLVSQILPDVWVKGGDYQIEDLPEAKPVLMNGGEVKILKFVDECSTSDIIARVRAAEN